MSGRSGHVLYCVYVCLYAGPVCLYARVAYCLQHIATSSRYFAVRSFINDLFFAGKKGQQ